MGSKKDKDKKKESKKESKKDSDKDLNKDSNKDSKKDKELDNDHDDALFDDVEVNTGIDPEKSEAARYNEEEFLDSDDDRNEADGKGKDAAKIKRKDSDNRIVN